MKPQHAKHRRLAGILACCAALATAVYVNGAAPSSATVFENSTRRASITPPVPDRVTGPAFNGDHAYAHVVNQVALGPRPVGSDAAWQAGNQIVEHLRQEGWRVETQEFIYRGIKGRNIIARSGEGPVVVLGAHYDTRPIADREFSPDKQAVPIVGANDGASGVAVLLEIARVLDVARSGRQVWLVFFDAEDRGGIDGWPYSVGASIMVERLRIDPEAVVIVDMVGDADQRIYFEEHSDRALSEEIWRTADRLGYADNIIPRVQHAVADDHLPFIRAGIPAIGMIDFDYRYWHTTEDTPDKVSPASLERVGRTLTTWLHNLPDTNEMHELATRTEATAAPR
ncbi:M28 family peptidase [Thiogranum longum]